MLCLRVSTQQNLQWLVQRNIFVSMERVLSLVGNYYSGAARVRSRSQTLLGIFLCYYPAGSRYGFTVSLNLSSGVKPSDILHPSNLLEQDETVNIFIKDGCGRFNNNSNDIYSSDIVPCILFTRGLVCRRRKLNQTGFLPSACRDLSKTALKWDINLSALSGENKSFWSMILRTNHFLILWLIIISQPMPW